MGGDHGPSVTLPAAASFLKRQPDAELILEKLVKNEVPSSWCCVMGNEGSGISKKVAEACTTRLRISMVSGVDSLSVPIATGILLHGLIERTKRNK